MKTIALIDLQSGGHRNAFMCLFAQACLQNNSKVICLFPESQVIKDWITIHEEKHLNNIIFIDFKPQLIFYKKFGRFNDCIRVFKYWKQCNQTLKKIEKQHQLKIDLVFFNWMDSQMANYLPDFILDNIFNYKWSGLYFHPTAFRINSEYLKNKTTFRDIDSVFLAKNCVAIAIHDEEILSGISNRLNKIVLLFPETADTSPPYSTHPLAKIIKDKANNRTVVGIIGLEPYKGTLSLLRLVSKSDSSIFFFAFTGDFKESFIAGLSENEKKEFNNFIQNLPDNCIWQTGSLEEGEEYNSVFCSFDIVYIMYKHFYSSSNRLTKAAHFNKIVLGNNYGCIGDDIPKYNLGETADENNIEEQYHKLEILRNRILAKEFPYEQWKKYAEKHSTERLKEKFEELLNLI